MGLAAKKQTQRYTYGDYLKWDDGERWELIDGEAYNMSPAPKRVHQTISMDIARQLSSQLLNKTCEVYAAPFDVRLPMTDEKEEDISNVVQPDITVVCDPKKLDENGCIGAPDFIIEIISPSNPRRDRMLKFNLYEMAGVKEYWIVTPEGRMVEVFLLGPDGTYARAHMYTEEDTVTISVLKDITIDLSTVLVDPASFK